MATTTTVPLIQLRARITPAEHRQLKVLAASQGRDKADLVADALRATYNINPTHTDATHR
jgi:hypothetical protein